MSKAISDRALEDVMIADFNRANGQLGRPHRWRITRIAGELQLNFVTANRRDLARLPRPILEDWSI